MDRGESKLSPRAKEKRLSMKKQTDKFTWETVYLEHFTQQARGKFSGKIIKDHIYECGFCKGRGEKPSGTRCYICGGKGLVSINPPAVICAYCKGKGEEMSHFNLTCTVCKGKGIVSIKMPVERCRHCKGTGAEPTNKLPCIICHGKGVVSANRNVDQNGYRNSDKKGHVPGSPSFHDSHFNSLSQHKSGIKPRNKMYEESGLYPYKIRKKEKEVKGKKTLNTASIHRIAKRLIAREWARILGKI